MSPYFIVLNDCCDCLLSYLCRNGASRVIGCDVNNDMLKGAAENILFLHLEENRINLSSRNWQKKNHIEPGSILSSSVQFVLQVSNSFEPILF